MTESEDKEPIEELPPEDGPIREAEEKAAEEAGDIGGTSGNEGIPEEQRATVEGGGGEAEGFELAEERLVEQATTDHTDGDPIRDAGEPEESPDPATHGEADHERSSEDDED